MIILRPGGRHECGLDPAQPQHPDRPSSPFPPWPHVCAGSKSERVPPSHQQPGIGTQWNFKVGDCRKTFAELKTRGVNFVSEPVEYPYAIGAEFTDPDGNHFSIVQPRSMSPPQR